MAGKSEVPSSDLGPDLSCPTLPKRRKLSENSSEETAEKDDSVSDENLTSADRLSIASRCGGPTETEARTKSTEESPPGILGRVVEESFEISRSKAEDAIAGTSRDRQHLSDQQIRQDQRSSAKESGGGELYGSEQIQTSLMGEHASYQQLSLIGNGAYGTVYKAKDLVSGHVVALKRVRVPVTEDGLPMSTLREIAALKQLERFEHPNIVRLLDVCQGSSLQLPSDNERSERFDRGLTLWLVFEHVERDLASFMSSCRKSDIPAAMIRQMSKEILLGVEFLHTHRILHRDLKPQNLLVTREGRIKIADFGLAKTYDFEMRLTSVVVTLWYRAPEVLLGCPYSTPVDIWSIACILAELNRLEPLFPGTSEGDQLDRIFQILGTPSQQEWPENVSLSWTAFPYRRPKPFNAIIPDLSDDGLDLIKSLLTFNPQTRLTAAQALRHRYFTENDV